MHDKKEGRERFTYIVILEEINIGKTAATPGMLLES
jgi:hypothetical protein